MEEINIPALLIGLLAIGYSIFTFYMRRKNPNLFWKLEPMKKIWGERVGYIIHFIGYTIIPFLFGLVVLIAGLNGRNLFD